MKCHLKLHIDINIKINVGPGQSTAASALVSIFSGLTLFVGRQEEHPACTT